MRDAQSSSSSLRNWMVTRPRRSSTVHAGEQRYDRAEPALLSHARRLAIGSGACAVNGTVAWSRRMRAGRVAVLAYMVSRVDLLPPAAQASGDEQRSESEKRKADLVCPDQRAGDDRDSGKQEIRQQSRLHERSFRKECRVASKLIMIFCAAAGQRFSTVV